MAHLPIWATLLTLVLPLRLILTSTVSGTRESFL